MLELPTAQLMAVAPERPDAHARPLAPIAAAPCPQPARRPSPAAARARAALAARAAAAAPRAGARPEPVAAAEPEPEPEPEPAGGGGTGTLRVQTRPWSKVFVDGRLVGNTPLMGVELSAGRHTLTFVNDDFGIRKTVKVDIQAGQT